MGFAQMQKGKKMDLAYKILMLIILLCAAIVFSCFTIYLLIVGVGEIIDAIKGWWMSR